MSNCFIWAMWQYLRHGGYVKMRKSHYGWWPHFMWSPDDGQYRSYSPAQKRRKPIPPLVFHGSVVDDE